MWVSCLLRHSLGRAPRQAGGPGGESEVEGKRSGGSWQVAGVHSADINPAPALHAEEEPQDSNDPRWVLWRQTRSCQRCGHRAAQERVRGSYGIARSLRHRSSCTAPCPPPALGSGDHGSTPAPPRVGPSLTSSRPSPRGSGSTDQELCVLHEGPTYPQYPQPSSSSTPPSCSASRRRRKPPQ